jgi:glycerol dehydrogenase-like iron-containing ADH family enzyme
MKKIIGGYDINTDLKQTGGPRSMYDSMMEQFQQDTAQIRTFTQRGGTPDQIATPDLNDPEVKQLLKTIAASMRQVETGIGKQNRTSDDILRATTG